MFKIYFKQAIQMLKQNKFISIIAILGTAMAIMMIMAIIIVDTVKNVDVAPEINRNRTLYLNREWSQNKNTRSTYGGRIRYETLNEYLYKMETPEYVTGIWNRTCLVSAEPRIQTTMAATDDAFWRVMSFSFIGGRGFTQEEFKSGIKNAVISEDIAKKVFRGEQAVGKDIEINFARYRVIGVVKNVSPVFRNAYAEVWVPYTTLDYEGTGASFNVLMLAGSKDDFPKIREEVNQAAAKFNYEKDPMVIQLYTPLDNRAVSLDLSGYSQKQIEDQVKGNRIRTMIIIAILLLVPAINLSGLSLSRIKKRTAEIGIRKAFGAKKYVILIQVLYENMITSLIGGIIGVVFSYMAILRLRLWLLKIPADQPIPAGATISFEIFLAVFAACVLINLLSAGIPALAASRMKIVDSLNSKK